MYKKISDYGIIGNLSTIALIARDGSIDWFCIPYIDSPSVFGALLDDKKGGHFSISPADDYDSTAEYLPGTNILLTKFRTRKGIMHLTDFMSIPSMKKGSHVSQQELYRRIDIISGSVTVRVKCIPRFDYARANSKLERISDGIIVRSDHEALRLSSTKLLYIDGNAVSAEWSLSKGDSVWLLALYGEDQPEHLDPHKAEQALLETEAYWMNWIRKQETGRSLDLGPYQQMIERSALVLKLLSYEPTGAIAAAATTSLPEGIGGARNWDYRFTWVRDSSFTLQALFNLGHMSETESYLRWIETLLSEHGAGRMQIMYSLRGEEELPEEELLHLDGYKGSRPVRIGNEAAKQRQLDIYGELMDAALKLSDYVGKIDSALWPFLRTICDYVVDRWKDQDSGIWEVRGGPFHFVYSKVMCWVALDRGIIIARRYGFPADLKKWEKSASDIKKEVIDKGWSDRKQTFVQHYDTESLDASNLLIPILGFLPYDDSRVVSTMEAIQRELSHDGFLYRYKGDDGLSGEEGTFLLCTFWLIDNLIGLNRLDEAEALLRKIEGTSNHLGLFSEEYDVSWMESLGNFPQAFTHIGYINSIHALRKAKVRKFQETGDESLWKSILLADKKVLNDGEPRYEIPSGEIAARLKASMNILRGAFFDTPKGRVAYERMRSSDAYMEYLKLSYTLKVMDLSQLESIQEKMAFWINLYNVIVIHGVIEFGIRDSVKEVRNFFNRIQYRVSDMYFSPNDIEHGILRCNRRPPDSLFRALGGGDRRLALSIKELDPRIHFALVCASSSCPPIDFYTSENLDSELTIAGKTFLNAGGAVIDRDKNRISLSRIFRWYGGDFGNTQAERLKFIARFMHEEKNMSYLIENADRIKIDYQAYDWRLNRY
jgi:GH15 family glucan-1,4-alpha-glucosidase